MTLPEAEAAAKRAREAFEAYVRGPWREAFERQLQLHALADLCERSRETGR